MHNIMAELLRTNEAQEEHEVGPVRCDVGQLISLSSAFPPSYLEFVTRYGGVKLFREGLGYLLMVLQVPQKVEDHESGTLFRFGSYDDDYCYFSADSMKVNEESPVYVFVDGELTPVADSFSEWFTLVAAELSSRQRLNPGEGASAPFTDQEKRVIRLRTHYKWQVIGYTGKYVVVNITNSSDSTLPCITLGVRSKDRTLNGAVRIDVQDLAPGMSENVNLDCYSSLIHPTEVELFALPDPSPSTRSNYFELRHSG